MSAFCCVYSKFNFLFVILCCCRYDVTQLFDLYLF